MYLFTYFRTISPLALLYTAQISLKGFSIRLSTRTTSRTVVLFMKLFAR